jgi:methionine sulfoxide reductase heme-binding subunit
MKSPWNDYSGRLSPLKLAAFVLLFCPMLWVATAFPLGWLGARPTNEAIHQIGLWTIRLIFIALAITPLRAILQWPRLILVRRMVGVAAFAYALTHLTLYTADQVFDLVKVASEIVLRIYLTIGFAAVLGLAALAATSTDGMIRRLGRRWQVLHRLVYLIALLAVVHYWMQSKLEIWEPTVMAGIYLWLIGYRLLARRFAVRGQLPLVWLAALGVAAAVLTGLGEAGYFWLAYGVAPMRVIAANWSLDTGVRPAVVVLALALAVTAAGALRGRLALPAKRRPPRRPPLAREGAAP